MLGHKMFQVLRSHFQGVLCTNRENSGLVPLQQVELLQGEDVIVDVDVTRFENLRSLLGRLQPQFVVNCVGIIKQRATAWTKANPEQAAALWLDTCAAHGVEVGTVLPKGGLRSKVMRAAYYEAVRAKEGWDDLTTWIRRSVEHARATRF